ncbi:MAG: RHS repeat-associated core domain-containing protein, partial [Pirellula sp.]
AQTIVETTKNAAGVATKRIVYTYGSDEISQTTYLPPAGGGAGWNAGTTLTFSHDAHTSVRMLTDAAGAIAQVFTYAAYGELIAIHNRTAQSVGTLGAQGLQSQALTSLLYNGEAFDSRIGQLYLRARWYDGHRFTTLDPFFGNARDPLSWNKYAYAHANPVMNADPTGMFSLGGMLGGMAIGGAIGGLSGAALGAAYAGFTGRMTIWQGMYQGAIVGAMLGSFIGGGIGIGAVKAGGMIGPAVFNLMRGFPAVSYSILIGMAEWRQSGSFFRNQEREIDDHAAYIQGRILGGNARSRNIIAGLAPKINNNAAGVAPELLASVMLGELYHMNILDSVFDDPENQNRSVGYAQINARTVLQHNHPELIGRSASEIGNALLDPERAVDILSYEIRYYANNQMGTPNASLGTLNAMWRNNAGSRESIVSGMSSAKDTDRFSILESNHTGQGLLGIEAYNDLRKLGTFSR